MHGHPVWVKAHYLPAETFGTAPMFLLSTDIDRNDPMSRSISLRLYDSDPLTRIASPTGTSQLIALGALVVLIGAVAFSKRKKEAFGGDDLQAAATTVD